MTAQFQTIELNLPNLILLCAEVFRLDFKYLKQLQRYLIYLNCLQKKFEYILNCRHAICNICIQIFKLNIENQKLYFRVNKYTICFQKISVVKRVKSLTADFRIFSINNSNIRDIVFLNFLRFLQNIIESALFIQDLFD